MPGLLFSAQLDKFKENLWVNIVKKLLKKEKPIP